MKVRTITLHGAHNYGAMLQAYALKRSLEELGHDVGVIDYLPEVVRDLNRKIKFSVKPKQFVRSLIGCMKYGSWKSRYNKFEKFKINHLNLTARYSNFDELKVNPPEADAYVCGSDQIWNPERLLREQFFLLFGEKETKRLSYAASFGVSQVPEQRNCQLKKYLEGFDSISMRETSGAKEIERITGHSAEVVVDPTLLLTKEKWQEMMPIEQVIKGDYMLVYCLEESPIFLEAVDQFAKESGLPVVVIAGSVINRIPRADRILIDIGPLEYLRLFNDASLIVTNSFHGTAFGLNLEKPLISVRHRTRNDRMSTLLEDAGWKDSQYGDGLNVQELLQVAADRLDSSVAERLKTRRIESLEFLKHGLGSAKEGA